MFRGVIDGLRGEVWGVGGVWRGVCVCVCGGVKSPCWWVLLLLRSRSFQESVCHDKVTSKITCCPSMALCGSVLGGGVDWWGIVEIGGDDGSCCWLLVVFGLGLLAGSLCECHIGWQVVVV